ncbi:MAG: RNA polymerase factor sigma-54 [Armatimonadetes bacterium]|nr:RNA polymerase factor sigma-54 [Armatimonadota bacterium]
MQGHGLAQQQSRILSGRTIPVQIQANAILNMSLLELQQFIETEAMENPALSLDDGRRCPVCGFLNSACACPVCGASMTRTDLVETDRSSERDYLERAFASADADTMFDPFRSVAKRMDLRDYLKRQARMALGGRKLRIAQYLIESLDDDGYFRESLFETAEEFAAAAPEIEDILSIVQSFDPPGIAARDLRESLIIQLRHLNAMDTTATNAERILLEHWDNFTKMKLKAIAKMMNVTVAVILEACEFIKDNLTPRPAAGYHAPFEELAPRDSAAIVPDIVVQAHGDDFMVNVIDCHGAFAKIDKTYEETYNSIKKGDSYLSEDDCKHIREHVERVKCILEAISLRKKTLARVAAFLVEYQEEFIVHGASHLKPLRQKDVAMALEVHESTICRALADKYCKMPSGEVISFEVFFDSALPIRSMISQIVAVSTEPLSDNEIAKRLAANGITIARRTVAKYREQLRMLPYQLRAA